MAIIMEFRGILKKNYFKNFSPYNQLKAIAILISIPIIIIIHGWSLLRYPEVHVDEALFANRAWAYIQTGKQMGSLERLYIDRVDLNWITNQWLISVIQAAVLRFYTEPNLFYLRILSLLFGCILLVSNFIIGEKLRG